MKSALLTIGVLISLFILGYQISQKTTQATRLPTRVTQPKADAIIRDTVTNTAGVHLAMAFNNTKKTATFVFRGETIELQQDQTASGISYSNPAYKFTEHQGEMRLKKEGNLIFSHKRTGV